MSGWIAHDGSGCPVPVGIAIEARHRSGSVVVRVIKPHHLDVYYNGIYHGLNPLFWAVNKRPVCDSACDVVAYRILDNGEQAKREARIEQFNKIAAGKEFLVEETLKVREKVK